MKDQCYSNITHGSDVYFFPEAGRYPSSQNSYLRFENPQQFKEERGEDLNPLLLLLFFLTTYI